MMISSVLYVGTGPNEDMELKYFGKAVTRVATPWQAEAVIRSGDIAVVPTTDVAKDTLILLGATPEWSRMATFETAGSLS